MSVLSISIREKSTPSPSTMKHLGPYKKYIIAAAVIQSIIVIIVGYILFKSKAMKEPLEYSGQERPIVEESLKRRE